MKKIVLNSKKYGNKICFVDDDDFELLSLQTWQLSHTTNTFYARTTQKNNQKSRAMHKIIMEKHFNTHNDTIIDHMDQNGLNNQKKNLRVADKSKNGANSKLNKANKSGYRGVTFQKDINKWRVRIWKNNKPISGGCFKNKFDAARAYDLIAKEIFGDFATLNFPETSRTTN